MKLESAGGERVCHYKALINKGFCEVGGVFVNVRRIAFWVVLLLAEERTGRTGLLERFGAS